MNNSLIQLMETYRKGNISTFHLGPFLPLTRIRERGLPFNSIMGEHKAMTEAALMSFEFGFESTVLPFDMNVEAEILGAEVRYHDAVDGNPVYPTIGNKPFSVNDDIDIPEDLPEKGRMPAILKSIRAVKEDTRAIGPVGIFLPGPFTLAGQVLDIDALYLALLKHQNKTRRIFKQLTGFILKLIDVYLHAGVDFMIVVEGAGASVSPKIFNKLILPFLQDIFRPKKLPQIIHISGNSLKVVDFMLACEPDGMFLDRDCCMEDVRERLPEGMPLFSECGGYDMLANATPAEITENVHRCLDMGFTAVGPRADIYPPAKIENIEAFVRAIKEYKN